MIPERLHRKAFEEGLQQLNKNTVQMAALAQSAVRKATDALERRNNDEAKEVFRYDQQIFQLQKAVESECTDLIALYAPVAGDLRTVTTVLKISTDIDRIGRGARNIAEVTLELNPIDPGKPLKIDKLSRNADLAIHMVDQAIRAFVERNDLSVREMGMFDDAVDQLYTEIFNDIVAGLKDRSIKPEIGVRLILINRHIERIADHAVNIANRVVYLVSGSGSPRGAKVMAPGEVPVGPSQGPLAPPEKPSAPDPKPAGT